MGVEFLELTCRDSIVARDGRPFGANAGNRMKLLDWPTPSMIAGSVRTALGRTAALPFSVATAQELLDVSVEGFLPVQDGELYLPAPLDCVTNNTSPTSPLRAIPRLTDDDGRNDCGADWPDDLPLAPVMVPLSADEDDFKPGRTPEWWPASQYARWVVGESITFDDRFLLRPEIESRVHVSLDRDKGSAVDGLLFESSGLVLASLKRFAAHEQDAHRSYSDVKFSIRIAAEGRFCEIASRVDGQHTTGGERRLVHFRSEGEASVWNCPNLISESLKNASRIRMNLVTPAFFQSGWMPQWLDGTGCGILPGTDLKLRLVGASTARWKAISGWALAPIQDSSTDIGDNRRHVMHQRVKGGPKPIKRVVPAGGVYFFDVEDGDPAVLEQYWLRSVSEGEQEIRDGFGLATWGTW